MTKRLQAPEDKKDEYNADIYRHKLLAELSGRISEPNAISMTALFEAVYDRPWFDRVNDTRDIRHLITDLRSEGVPICSTSAQNGGGYFLAAAGSELANYLRKTERRALLILMRNAKIKKISLPNYLGQIKMNMEVPGDGENQKSLF